MTVSSHDYYLQTSWPTMTAGVHPTATSGAVPTASGDVTMGGGAVTSQRAASTSFTSLPNTTLNVTPANTKLPTTPNSVRTASDPYVGGPPMSVFGGSPPAYSPTIATGTNPDTTVASGGNPSTNYYVLGGVALLVAIVALG